MSKFELLFVNGYLTYKRDVYQNLFNFLKSLNIKVIPVEYSETDDIESLSGNIEKLINENENIKVVIGHSLGGFIVYNLMRQLRIRKNVKIVLMCPYISQGNIELNANASFSSVFLYYYSKFVPQFVDNFFYLPQGLLIDKRGLGYKNNLMSNCSIESLYFKSLKQLFYANRIMNNITEDEIVETVENYSAKIIYAMTEEITKFTETLIEKLQAKGRIILIHSKHEPFNDKPSIKTPFEKTLRCLLEVELEMEFD